MPTEEIVSVVPELLQPAPPGGHPPSGNEAQSSPLSHKEERDVKERTGHGRQLSAFQTYVNLVTVVIGAGIMALPQLPLRGGWVLSALILLVVILSTAESGLHMWKAFMASEGRMSTYEDLGREAWGPLGQVLAAVVANLFLFGIYSAYTVLIGMQLENLSQNALDKQHWILILYPAFLALALVPDLSALSRLVPFGMVAACATAACIIGKSMMDSRRWKDWDQHQEMHSPWPQESVMALGVVLATCIGAMTFHPVVPAVLQDMAQPEEFPRAMLGAATTCGILYLAVMLCGYHGYGVFIRQDIVQSMTHSPANLEEALSNSEVWDWMGEKSLWVPPLVSSLVLVNIILSMPIMMMAVFYSVQDFKPFAPHLKPGSWANWIMRMTLVTIAVAIGFGVPRFTLVFGFFCAISGPAASLAMPLLLSGAVLRRNGVAQSRWRGFFHGVIVILSVLCMVSGVYTSVMDFLGDS